MPHNKPILPNAYVDVLNRNLGVTPNAPSGIYQFVGIAVDGAGVAETILSVGNVNEVPTKVGLGELADTLIEFFNGGGRKASAWRVEPTTTAVLGSVTKVAVGSSTGTITLALEGGEIIPNEFNLEMEITKSGALGVGKFKFSTGQDKAGKAVSFSPSIIIPAGGTYVIPNTHIELTFVPGGGPTIFELGDTHKAPVTGPIITNAKVESAVDAFIAQTPTFDGIAVSVPSDSALVGSIRTKVVNAEKTPDFRYIYCAMRPALSTSATQAVTQAVALMATIANDRIQIVTAEANITRPNQGDQFDKNAIGVLIGRRSSLPIAEDIGLVSKGQLPQIVALRTGWTDTTIEDLDGLFTATIRAFKGLSGFYPTNGHMSDPFSDLKKDAFRLVLDKASRIARISVLQLVKIKIDPTDVSGSSQAIQDNIDGALGVMVGNEEIVDKIVTVPAGQDILTSEEIIVKIDVVPFGHANFIGIEIGLINPLKVAS